MQTKNKKSHQDLGLCNELNQQYKTYFFDLFLNLNSIWYQKVNKFYNQIKTCINHIQTQV